MTDTFRALCAEHLPELRGMFERILCVARSSDGNIQLADRLINAVVSWSENPLAQPEPVAISNRLPDPEECDAEGGCWWWHPGHKEDDFIDGWILLNPKWAGSRRDSDDSLIYTHWLPANALPTPEAND